MNCYYVHEFGEFKVETSDEKLRLNRSIVISYLILVDINTYREILFNFHIYISLLNIRGFEYIFIIAISILGIDNVSIPDSSSRATNL